MTLWTVFLLDEYVELENKQERCFYLHTLSLNCDLSLIQVLLTEIHWRFLARI